MPLLLPFADLDLEAEVVVGSANSCPEEIGSLQFDDPAVVRAHLPECAPVDPGVIKLPLCPRTAPLMIPVTAPPTMTPPKTAAMPTPTKVWRFRRRPNWSP